MIQQIYFDLTLDEIAIILHSFLKKSKKYYATINFHLEKYLKKICPEKQLDEDYSQYPYEDRYTLIIIASTYRMPKHEILAIYKRICDANNIKYFKGDDV